MLLALILAAQVDGALVLDGPAGASGLKAFLSTAGTHARSVSPEAISATLRDMVGVDLLAEQPAWGLAKRGPRTLVVWHKSVGLSAPIADVKKARAALKLWSSNGRVGRISGKRLFTASGREAAALLNILSQIKPFRANGQAWLWLRGRPPLKEASVRLDASATGLVARGPVVPLEGPIVTGPAPSGCDGAPPGCLRATVGKAGFELVALAFFWLKLEPPPDATSLVARLVSIDPQQLTDPQSIGRALHVTTTAEPPGPPGPGAAGQLDLAYVDQALARLSPIDAMRGSFVASVYAARLLYGPLVRNAGPLTLTATPAAKGAADVEIRLPIR